jgi:hypothetical protein
VLGISVWGGFRAPVSAGQMPWLKARPWGIGRR